MYHIFQVYDYKGGELSIRTNLPEDDFIIELIERVLNYEKIDLSLPEPKLKLSLFSSIKSTTLYAGGYDSIVLRCFKSSINSLEAIDHEQFIKTNYQLFIDKLKSYEQS